MVTTTITMGSAVGMVTGLEARTRTRTRISAMRMGIRASGVRGTLRGTGVRTMGELGVRGTSRGIRTMEIREFGNRGTRVLTMRTWGTEVWATGDEGDRASGVPGMELWANEGDEGDRASVRGTELWVTGDEGDRTTRIPTPKLELTEEVVTASPQSTVEERRDANRRQAKENAKELEVLSTLYKSQTGSKLFDEAATTLKYINQVERTIEASLDELKRGNELKAQRGNWLEKRQEEALLGKSPAELETMAKNNVTFVQATYSFYDVDGELRGTAVLWQQLQEMEEKKLGNVLKNMPFPLDKRTWGAIGEFLGGLFFSRK